MIPPNLFEYFLEYLFGGVRNICTFVKNKLIMPTTKTALEVLESKRESIKNNLSTIKLPKDGTATGICWTIGQSLKISGPTVINYLSGNVKDGYLGEAIYSEFKRLRYAK